MTRQRLSSGIPGLDIVLDGGFFQSGVYIIQGKPGAGKTILANQICFAHASQGGKAAYVTLLTESIPRMFENLASLSFFDESLSPDRIYYVSGFDVLETGALQGLIRLLRAEINDQAPSILVLDGMVSASEKAQTGTEFRKFIHELQGYASAFQCTIFLLGTTDTESAVQAEHTMVEGLIDLADTAFHTQSQRSLQVRKFRGGTYLAGRHAFTITEAGLQVFARLESLRTTPQAKVDTRKPLSTGIAGLDKLSAVGGLRSSSSTLLVGPAGSGKTTFGAQFLGASSGDSRGLFFGFNESPAEFLSNADAHGAGLSPLVANGTLEVQWHPDAENFLDELGYRLVHAVQTGGARRVFIDGLNGFICASIYPGRIARFLKALISELRRLGATSVFTIESRDGTIEGLPAAAAGLPALYDNLISLRSVENGSRIKRVLSVTKMRGCDFDDSIHEYGFGPSGLLLEAAPGNRHSPQRAGGRDTAAGRPGDTSA